MTEEIKNEEVKECFCKKRFNDVVVVAIGTFVGVYCALSLFTAIHRPPCPMMMGFGYHHPGNFQHVIHHKFPPQGKFKHDKFRGDFEQQNQAENKE